MVALPAANVSSSSSCTLLLLHTVQYGTMLTSNAKERCIGSQSEQGRPTSQFKRISS